MKIAIGADHRGYELKEALKKHTKFNNQLIQWIDCGAPDAQRSDYPVFTAAVCLQLQQGNAQRGILICSTGVGMSIAANRYKNIYAALVWNETIARSARQEDNANVLVFAADFTTIDQAVSMIAAWLDAEFKGGRYQERLDMID
ncbi:MAG: RpiB/LacA/LacB family sugar-phosphate isomerase [Candidatus Babeliales bacterium]|nr:RpiB/LacA/LacB family sugar-phosphate isomerase [Candidatus Babeliales bacterium]